MTDRFRPRLDILPPAQRALWPQLAGAHKSGWVLYGGTAIALHLGHRPSVDFDFFSDRPLDRAALRNAMPWLERSRVLQDQPDTWTLEAAGTDNASVKISFFGSIGFGRVGMPRVSEDGILEVASLDDLMATKLKVMLQRVEAKDYRDVVALIRANVSLDHGLSSAALMYGPQFQPSESLKVLVYFEGGDLQTLMIDEKNTLIEAVRQVRELPPAQLVSRKLSL